MTQTIKTGYHVAVLDDDIQGVVVAIGTTISVETTDGFVMEFDPKELVIQHAQFKQMASNTGDIMAQSKQLEPPRKSFASANKRTSKMIPAMEIDLHIDKLVKNTRGYNNYDMLNIQMDAAKRQLEWAIHHRKQRIIFIHGVGEGVLKAELETLFRRYDGIKFYAADVREYGLGAIEVYRFQNGS